MLYPLNKSYIPRCAAFSCSGRFQVPLFPLTLQLFVIRSHTLSGVEIIEISSRSQIWFISESTELYFALV